MSSNPAVVAVISLLLVSTAHADLDLFENVVKEKSRSSAPARKQTYCVVKVSEFDKTTTYHLLTSAEGSAMYKELSSESRLVRKAYDSAKRDWRADEATKRKRFPIMCPMARRLTKMGEYRKRADAEKKYNTYIAREAEKNGDGRDEDRNKDRKEKDRAWQRRSQRLHGVSESKRQKARRDFDQDWAEDSAKDGDRSAAKALALEAFKAKLAELKVLAATPKPAAE